MRSTDADPFGALRRFVLILFALGASGSAVDLLLIGHVEDRAQLVPLVLLGAGLVAIACSALMKNRGSLHAFRLVMWALIAGGALGLWLHLRGNLEFERELSPDRTGLDLYWAAIQGASPPSLAPATLIHLGLIGLAYTYHHPALAPTAGRAHDHTGGK